MSDFLQKCQEYFDTKDFYEVLKVDRDATAKEIKKAYHRLSLLVHPDRVDENAKKEATEKFKVLGRIHSILQDSDKRKRYDDYGEFDDESGMGFNWTEYWNVLFKEISVKDIQDFEKEYIGSEMEKRDIKKAYLSKKGDMNHILEMVPFSNPDSEPRIIEIVRKMVDDGEVEEYSLFFNEPKRRKILRRKLYEKEKKEAEKISFEDLQKEIQVRRNENRKNFIDMIQKIEDKYTKKRKSVKGADDEVEYVPKKKSGKGRAKK